MKAEEENGDWWQKLFFDKVRVKTKDLDVDLLANSHEIIVFWPSKKELTQFYGLGEHLVIVKIRVNGERRRDLEPKAADPQTLNKRRFWAVPEYDPNKRYSFSVSVHEKLDGDECRLVRTPALYGKKKNWEYLSKDQMENLLFNAMRLCEARGATMGRMHPIEYLYRSDKLENWEKYSEIQRNKHRDWMRSRWTGQFSLAAKERRNSQGHFSPINYCPVKGAKGTFFFARPDKPLHSPFGEYLIKVPPDILFDVILKFHFYFADIKCYKANAANDGNNIEEDVNRAHYICIVICEIDTDADRYCKKNLIRLDKWHNPFFCVEKNHFGDGYVFKVPWNFKAWIEIFYLHDEPLTLEWLDVIRDTICHNSNRRGRQEPTPAGHCHMCNPYERVEIPPGWSVSTEIEDVIAPCYTPMSNYSDSSSKVFSEDGESENEGNEYEEENDEEEIEDEDEEDEEEGSEMEEDEEEFEEEGEDEEFSDEELDEELEQLEEVKMEESEETDVILHSFSEMICYFGGRKRRSGQQEDDDDDDNSLMGSPTKRKRSH